MLVSTLKVACFFVALIYSAFTFNQVVISLAQSRHDKNASQDTGLWGVVIFWSLFYALTLMED